MILSAFNKKNLIVFLILSFCLFTSTESFAHKVKVFASVEGGLIKGYVYYTSSSRAKNVKLDFTVPDGSVIGEIRTDENGEFVAKAQYRTDTLITLRSADGHMAEWLIRADELPIELPEYNTTSNVHPDKIDTSSSLIKELRDEDKKAISTEEISAVIKQELRPLQAQLNQMRAELEEQNNKKQLQDIFGALGYLLGLTGIALYIAARREKGCK